MSFKEWKDVELGDISLITKLAGFEFTKYIEYKEEGEIIALRALNVKGGSLNLENIKRIDKNISDSLTRSKLFKNDILITYTGTVGEVAIIKENDKFHLAPNVAKITIQDGFNPYFYFSYFRSENFKKQIENYSGGSTQTTIPMKNIRQLKVPIVPIKEQEAIAKILSDLDNKIEVNNKINQRLEEMAQSIFKHWFVDFEFSGGEGKPYKSSGGEMVESELGMIPKGWEVHSLYNLAEYINGTSFKGKDYGDKGIPIIKIAELKNGITDGTKFFKGEKDKKFYLKNEDILFSWSGNPDTSIDTFIWDKGDAILNQHIFKVIPNENIGYCYIYVILKSLKSTFANIARNKQTTGLGHVTVKDLKELKVSINYNKIEEFNKLLQPIIKRIINNNYSNQKLINLRDTLLPKLMSGEIRVQLEK